jgi:glycerol-3-phosphate acyltransferase PlsY
MTGRDFLVIALAFGLGAIPTALWVGKARGVDLRRTGSGNLGATNVYRSLGPRAGLAVLGADMLKGAAAVVLARRLGESGAIAVAAAAAAVLGHVLSPLAGFRGGKGVAAGGGAMLALAPAAGLIALGVFAATLAMTRYVSLGSIAAAAALPVAVAATAAREVPGLRWASIVLAALVIARHRANLGRLLHGTERRFAFRRGAAGEGTR